MVKALILSFEAILKKAPDAVPSYVPIGAMLAKS